jgi:hypothetical protein
VSKSTASWATYASIDVPTDMAVLLALIVNELVTNVIKGKSLKLIVSDQGKVPFAATPGKD